ncbi:MobH family relaxase [Methylobacter sp. S3L5C]|uniref:MobH family relaxase n=1 Tax=Methylobacter sp. S3L5C TaxID=2839024 RepID=UPI001FACC73F|nr:MobH family relaxase [Methylobacter sp. S3L5C]UOA07405.1 TraI domain-containing protein [Methylobacter sp. S3L5C]
MGKIITAFINRYGKSLFGDRPSLLPEQSPAPDEEIPRYPPFMKGLPAAPVDRILDTQIDLINAIEHALSLPDDLYQTIAVPVIARYAAFSHLLPASESHHHRGAGGLFRHGLEVAHWATQAAQGCLFATQATPRERKEQELRWRLAVCFAGLLHDIGKPVSDMAVVDRHGEYTWNPCDENLTDWAAQNGIDRYFLRWRENRHKRHEQFSALVIERVLTRASRTYLLAPGPDIMQAMLETIHGLDRGAKLYELVMTADCKSVERDLKAHSHTVDSAMGMPVEKYLFDAMRRLIKSGHWLANEKGARLWRFKEGLHIVWRSGARDIVDTLIKDKVPGIPRDEDTLADILIERGLAIPKILPDGRHYRYWRMQPQSLEVTLYMLRLASAELIFTNEPPVVVEGIEVDEASEETVNAESGQNSTQQVLQPDVQIEKPGSTPECATSSDQQPTQTYQEQSNNDLSGDTPLPLLIMTQSTSDDTDNSQQIVKPTAVADTAKKTEWTNNPSKPDDISEQVIVHQSEADRIDSARNWLYTHDLAGIWLIQLAAEINAQRLQLGVDLLETQDKWLLPYPSCAQKLNVEPNLFIKTLDEKGWLVTDILSPMRKVQVINQVRGLLLATVPSGFLKELLDVLTLPVITATSNQPSEIINQAPTKNKKTKLSSVKSAKSEKSHDQQQSLITDQPKPAETQLSKSTSLKSTPIKPEVFSQPKPQSVTEPAITQKPEKQKKLVEAVMKTAAALHSNHNTLVGSPAVMALISHLQKTRPVSEPATPDRAWYNVEESEIAQCLQQHPGLKRSALLREMANHPDCQIDEGGIKVRISP